MWASTTGECLQTFYGHSAEIVAAEFNPADAGLVATGSMDGTARIYHVATGQEVHRIDEHMAEVIAARFSRDGQMLLTGSFDNNGMIWDVRSKSVALELRGHEAELSNCVWNFDCSLVATGSLDSTARVWDLRMVQNSAHVLDGHRHEEVLDVCFDLTGRQLATAGSDGLAKVWDAKGAGALVATMSGHMDEVSKVSY